MERTPAVPDLSDLLDFQPGQIQLRGRRFLLINADALGTLRRDLVSTLGRERAKGFLLRYGWSCGYRDALAVKAQYPQASESFLQEQGPVSHMLEGVVHVRIGRMTVNMGRGEFYFEGVWTNSYEAEQHLCHFGASDDPACWTLVGYAGGYSTGLFDHHIVYKEITCTARGDKECRFVGQSVAAWGPAIQDELRYYEQTTITEELQEAYQRIRQQHLLLTRITSIHEQLNQMVLAGHDRSVIMETVGRILNSPIVVEDRQFHPIVTWAPPGWEGNLAECQLGHAVSVLPRFCAWLRKVDREKRALDWNPERHEQLCGRTTAPMVLGDEVIGYLSVIHTNSDVDSDLRRMVAERAAAVLSFDLLRERTQWETERRLKGEFLDILLDESAPVAELEIRARHMGLDFRRPYRYLCISVHPPISADRKSLDQGQLIRARQELLNLVYASLGHGGEAMVVERAKGVVVLAPAADGGVGLVQLAQEILDQRRKLLHQVALSACVSEQASSIEGLRKAFADCNHALDVMVRLGHHNRVMFAEELSLFDILYASAGQDHLVQFAQRKVSSLIEYDASFGGELTQTVYAFLLHECNLQRTARALNISLSGLKYRLQRVRDIGGIDLDNPEERFQLQLALRVLLVRGALSFTTPL
ncbi:MAG: XylR N-terminal domain-containing protein [Alicyclobacillaceae bacterium]|nr:XylR N-terminal domain-containing protein [Alicyclobacillaceae bacterium]